MLLHRRIVGKVRRCLNKRRIRDERRGKLVRNKNGFSNDLKNCSEGPKYADVTQVVLVKALEC